ncbi:hypothetical protein H072_141 [Dactylellina haptotyla CBS 200.50]|uniref:F-box domain-containing protein n=1 Tax=Dactylellina haptotyla (strain CBS 200.50) TaxID=1284197 RepID=S8AY35_DACHA|nr:hypothetical protein H072_141 [Dactylellina haptotyla CBS 200.50]
MSNTNIFSLPPELLLIIFADNSLDNRDVANCQSTCKRFRQITKDLPIHYTFRVDHVAQPAWKLIRHLLVYPRIAKRITSINVTWHRRQPVKLETWTREWRWEEAEKEKIEAIGERRLSTRTIGAIFQGLNSEALLPFLLCLTPNLESLDIGDAVLSFIQPEYSIFEAVRLIEYSSTGVDRTWQGSEGSHRDSAGRYLDKVMDAVRPGYPSLWFHENIRPGDWLPGLVNLKKFYHSCVKYGDPYDSNYGWPIVFLRRIMLLPNIRKIKIKRATCMKDGLYMPISRGGPPKDFQSSLKSLEILGTFIQQEEYDVIAKLTGSLEYLALNPRFCGDHRDHLHLSGKGTLVDDTLLAARKPYMQPFLQYNQGILTDRQVVFTEDEFKWNVEERRRFLNVYLDQEFGPMDDEIDSEE